MRATTSFTQLLFKTGLIRIIFDSSKPQQLVSNLSVSDFLLSSSEYNCLREDFIVLVARVIVNEFKQLKFLAGGVPSHISHRYSQQMASKSTVVHSIGVLLRHPIQVSKCKVMRVKFY